MIQKLDNYIEPEDEAELDEDILVSYDYYYNNSAPSVYTPEKELAKSVLIFAVIDYLSINKDKAAYRDAYKWFFKEKDPDYIFSFSNICYIMGINETKFRERLKKRKHTKDKFIIDGKRIN